jgi:hypothetical protein
MVQFQTAGWSKYYIEAENMGQSAIPPYEDTYGNETFWLMSQLSTDEYYEFVTTNM